VEVSQLHVAKARAAKAEREAARMQREAEALREEVARLHGQVGCPCMCACVCVCVCMCVCALCGFEGFMRSVIKPSCALSNSKMCI